MKRSKPSNSVKGKYAVPIKCLDNQERSQLLRTVRDRKSAQRDHMIIDMFLNTGLRLSELCSLDVGSIKGRRSIIIQGKGKKIREIPLNSSLRSCLAQYLIYKKKHDENTEADAPLFCSRLKLRLSVRAVQRMLKKWLGEAEVDKRFSVHSLRHTFATDLYRRSNNIRAVQMILGHSRIDTTTIYTHISRDGLAETVELLNAA